MKLIRKVVGRFRAGANGEKTILDAIGNTPLVRLSALGKGLRAKIYAKLEFMNPGGSIKDRIAVKMVAEAEKEGFLEPGGTIIEATSGNTGLGLAIVAAAKGYKSVFVMPDKMSREKISLLRSFGAEVVITPTDVEPDDPRSYYCVASRLAKERPNAFFANQYANMANPRAHYETTGPEIWEQSNGMVTAFVAGMGTGGTISGAGRFLKGKRPDIKVLGVDPIGSLYYDYFTSGLLTRPHTYKVEGIGEDFLPATMDFGCVDEVLRVSDEEAFYWTRRLVKLEGMFAGGSSGAAVAAALRYARRLSETDLVVVILPDSGDRYLSKLFSDEWLKENAPAVLEAESSGQEIGAMKEAA